MRRTGKLGLIALVAGLLVLTSIPPVGAAKPAATVLVAADVEWAATSVTVADGEAMSIRAHGQAITGPLRDYPGARSGPDGQVFDCPSQPIPPSDCNLNGEPYGALVAKIGDSVFLVGGWFEGTAPEAGEIYLGVNDNLGFHVDNRGGFAAQIRTG